MSVAIAGPDDLEPDIGDFAPHESDCLDQHVQPLDRMQTTDERDRRPGPFASLRRVREHQREWHRDEALAIPLWAPSNPLDPRWSNGWFQGLDALALYCFIADGRPRRYIEVGSGNSTKFARRAIVDHSLDTTITSIDPEPRAEIDDLCDRVVRSPLEDVDLSVFSALDEGDIVFIDASHQCLQNNDVTTFFLDVLPQLSAGVLVQLHDIFLPWDYPPQMADRLYSVLSQKRSAKSSSPVNRS